MIDAVRFFTQPIDAPLSLVDGSSDEVVLWNLTQLSPDLTVALRCAILQKVYRGDYHQDVADLPRLAKAVRDREERVFFWGSEAAVSELRHALSRRLQADEMELQRLADDLGTATFISREDILGVGVFELSRTGSMCRTQDLTSATMSAIRTFWEEAKQDQQIVYCTPRNRASSANVPGGMGIQRFHQRDLRSAFLGFAPWHVMAGGVNEWLEFRAIVKDRSRMAGICKEAIAPMVAGLEAQALCNAVLGSLGLEEACVAEIADEPYGVFPCQKTGDPEAPVFLTRADLADHETTRVLMDLVGQHSCTIVRLALSADTLQDQARLLNAGFALLALEFPVAAGAPWTGHWVRPNPALPPAKPAYFRDTLPDPKERLIMEIGEKTMRRWHSTGWVS